MHTFLLAAPLLFANRPTHKPIGSAGPAIIGFSSCGALSGGYGGHGGFAAAAAAAAAAAWRCSGGCRERTATSLTLVVAAPPLLSI